MKTVTLAFGDLFSITKLFSDYLNGQITEYFKYDFRNRGDIERVAALVIQGNYDREKLLSIILDNNRRLGCTQRTLENIELLRRTDTLCVFSGQQATVCASPMYTVNKALSSVKLARQYQEKLGRPVVPCFWVATDDHDFEEVRHANFLTRAGELLTATFNPKRDPSGLPAAEIIFDDGIADFHRSVEKALIDTEFKKPLLELTGEIYAPGHKLSEAFARMLNHFLGEWGIVLVDPNFPGLKDFFKPVFAREIREHSLTHNLYEERSKSLLSRGYHAQVHKTGENLNIFYFDKKRSNLVIRGSEFSADSDSKRFSREELLDIVDKSPWRFSSNVLLRPIAQCAAFPTVAQVVGPSELAYFAQITPLFDFFGVPVPIIHPRSGLTIVEPHIAKVMHRYDITVASLRNDPEAVISGVIDKLFPSEIANAVADFQERVKHELEDYALSVKESDPEEYNHLVNFKRHVDYELKQLRKRLKASHKKRHDNVISQIRKACAFLFPANKLQERVISPLYYADKFGPDIFRTIYESLDIANPSHTVLEL